MTLSSSASRRCIAALLVVAAALGPGLAADKSEPHFVQFTKTLHEQSFDFEKEWAMSSGGVSDDAAKAVALIARAANDKQLPYTLGDLDRELKTAPEEYRSLREKLAVGRQRLIDQLICEAIPEANRQLAKLGCKRLREFKTVNSGSLVDVTRDFDLTVFGGDWFREEAFFIALKKVALDNHKIECDYSPCKGLRIKSLDVAFHLGSFDTPELVRCIDLQSFALDYQSVIEGMSKNPEAYIGWGADTEVKGRRMQTFKRKGKTRIKVFKVGTDGKVNVRAFCSNTSREIQAVLNGPVEKIFRDSKRTMNIVSSLLQAAHHEKEAQLAAERHAAQQRDYEQGRRKTKPAPLEVEAPDKGPLKYAERALEQLIEMKFPSKEPEKDVEMRFPGEEQKEKPVLFKDFSEADQRGIVETIFPPGAGNDPTQSKVIQAHVKFFLDLPNSLTGSFPADSNLQWEVRKALAILRRAASVKAVAVARDMLNPPFDADFVAEQIAHGGWNKLSDSHRRKLAAQLDENYKKAVAIEAMENLLVSMWMLKQTKLPTYRPFDENFGDATIGQIFDAAHRLYPEDPELVRVLKLAAEYGEAYEAHRLAHSNTTLPAEVLERASAGAAQRLSKIRVELLERVLHQESPGKRLLAGAAAQNPKDYIRAGPRPEPGGPDLSRPRGVIRAIVEAMLGDVADRVLRAFRSVETSDSEPRSSIRRRIWDELFSLDTVVDILNLVEAAQKGDSPTDLGKQLGLMALSRVHWSIGLAIGYAYARDDPEAMAEFERGLAFMAAALVVPHAGLVKVIADIEIGLVKVTIEPLFESLNAELVRLRYLTGDMTVLDDAYKLYWLENGAEKVDVDRVKLFKEKFKLWTEDDYDGYNESWKDGRPVLSRGRVNKTCPSLVNAHDRYARATCRIMAKRGPLWPTLSEEKPDTWVPRAEEVARLAQEVADAARPLIVDEVNKYLSTRWTRTNVRRGEEGQNKDLIAAALVTVYLADFLTGLESTWKTDLAEQLLAKNRVEQDAALADLDVIAEGLRARLEKPSTGPFPKVILRPVDDAESLEEVRNGERPVPVSTELLLEGVRPEDLPAIDVAIEPGPMRPADPARTTTESGGIFINPVTFRAIRVDTGAELAACTIELKVLLPAKKRKLELKLETWVWKSDRGDLVETKYTYYEGGHPDAPASWKRTFAPGSVCSFGRPNVVMHGTCTTTVRQSAKGSYVASTADYDHGFCAGTWREYYPDGTVKNERTFENDRVVTQTQFHEKSKPQKRWTYRPAGPESLKADGEIVEFTREGRMTAKGSFVDARWRGGLWEEGHRHGAWEISNYEPDYTGKGPQWLRWVERGSYDRGEKTGTWTSTYYSFRDHSRVDLKIVTEYGPGGVSRLRTETNYHPDGQAVRRLRSTRTLAQSFEIETIDYDEKGKVELHTVETRDFQGRETIRRLK